MMPSPELRLAIATSIAQKSLGIVCQQYNHVNVDKVVSSDWIVVSGGSINQAYRIDMGVDALFVKLHDVQHMAMFEAEAAGLQALREAKVVRVPEVYTCACDDSYSWLVMEYITLGSHNSVSEKLFAQQLAAMHRCTGELFGWFRNNTIGSTPQINTATSDWINFYRAHRLAYQLQLANQHGFPISLQDKGERLLGDLHVFFEGYEASPSLLHGDLWSGNHAVDSAGSPVIFDPAVYYGDRETDIAMTELFGGLSSDFYAAYHEAYPLHEGYKVRKTLYNLYHILNHANLFGVSYVRQAETMMDQLLTKC